MAIVSRDGDELDVERGDPEGEEDLGDQGQPSDPPALDHKPVQRRSIQSFFEQERGAMGSRERGDLELSLNLNQCTAKTNPTGEEN